MPKYIAKVLVTYTVVADDIEECTDILENNTEYPVFPNGVGWSEAEEIVSIELQEN